ncbi:NUDIX domain-containing protein [Actinospica robiniae]|uniref:NUDIX domain-containing protein n=1 Tax=Actinospica robiniae TaxID=304901 RepID=UPI0004154B72|nr:NUDIX domain-containing protein [Actinospica robiniae]
MIRYKDLGGATVCVCAPTRSATDVAQLELLLGVAGASVLTPVPYSANISPLEQAALATLHLRKIAASDVVVVANSGGYAGSGTASEIAYALRLGKPVMFLNDPGTLAVETNAYNALVGRRAFLDLRPTALVPRDVVIGSIVTACAPDDPVGRAAWFRIDDSLRFPTRAQALEALDPARVTRGADAERVALALEEKHPGTGEGEHTVLELEFIAELTTRAHPAPTRRGSQVALMVRDQAGAIALIGKEPGGFALPGGEIAEGEYPTAAAIRCAREQLGLSQPLPRLVALDTGANGPGGMAATFVFDAATLDDAGRDEVGADTGSPDGECVFVAEDESETLVDRRTARWLYAASLAQRSHNERAVTDRGSWTFDCQGRTVFSGFIDPGGPLVQLEDGHVPGARPVWEWHEHLPECVPVTQAGVWAFDRDGRVLLQHRVDQGRFALPAGHPEPQDRDQLATAAREAFEESQILIDQRSAVLLGYQVTYDDAALPNGQAQARFAAPVLAYYPICPDTDPKLEGRRRPYRRYLVDIWRAPALLDWGPHAQIQARAAGQAARVLRLPVDRPAADGYRDQGDPDLPARTPDWNLEL